MTATRLGLLAAALCLVPALQAAPRDGRLFDPGIERAEPAESAPAPLALLTPAIGSYAITYRTYAGGEEVHAAEGFAEVRFMNQGWSLLQRFHCPDADTTGADLDEIVFLAYNPAADTWVMGSASGLAGSISIHSGGVSEAGLDLHDVRRIGGGAVLTRSRITGSLATGVTREVSTDGGETWAPVWRKEFRRLEHRPTELATGDGYGEPDPSLPPEARAFDFLIGEWNESHMLQRPDGPIRFPSNGTAVYCLNGRGILEFSWMTVDPSFPDASTSIVRLWNEASRRWESMYITNRFNGILHFGGVEEGDRIVLHRFDVDRTVPPINNWIFSEREPESYFWHALTSADRGATWDTTWTIAGTRKDAD